LVASSSCNGRRSRSSRYSIIIVVSTHSRSSSSGGDGGGGSGGGSFFFCVNTSAFRSTAHLAVPRVQEHGGSGGADTPCWSVTSFSSLLPANRPTCHEQKITKKRKKERRKRKLQIIISRPSLIEFSRAKSHPLRCALRQKKQKCSIKLSDSYPPPDGTNTTRHGTTRRPEETVGHHIIYYFDDSLLQSSSPLQSSNIKIHLHLSGITRLETAICQSSHATATNREQLALFSLSLFIS